MYTLSTFSFYQEISSIDIVNHWFSIYYQHIDITCSSICECKDALQQLIIFIKTNGISTFINPWIFVKYSSSFSHDLIHSIWNCISYTSFYSSPYRFSIFYNLCEEFFHSKSSVLLMYGTKLFCTNPYMFFEVFVYLKIYRSIFDSQDMVSFFCVHVLYSNYISLSERLLYSFYLELYNKHYPVTLQYIYSTQHKSIQYLCTWNKLPYEINKIIQSFYGIYPVYLI